MRNICWVVAQLEMSPALRADYLIQTASMPPATTRQEPARSSPNLPRVRGGYRRCPAWHPQPSRMRRCPCGLSIRARRPGSRARNLGCAKAVLRFCWLAEPESLEVIRMKSCAFAGIVAAAMLVLPHRAKRPRAPGGVYRAGCVGPHGAAVVRRPPPPRYHHSVTCANGVYRAGCVGPHGAAVVRKPY